MAPEDAAGSIRRGKMSHGRLGPFLGLAVAVGLMVLSLSAFVVGSNAGGGTGILVGQPAVNFSARDLAGQRRTLHEFRGRPVLLAFGTTADLVSVDFSGASLPDDVQILLLAPELHTEAQSLDRGQAAMILWDDGGLVAEQYGVWPGTGTAAVPVPQAVLISATGEILDRGTLAGVLGPIQARNAR